MHIAAYASQNYIMHDRCGLRSIHWKALLPDKRPTNMLTTTGILLHASPPASPVNTTITLASSGSLAWVIPSA